MSRLRRCPKLRLGVDGAGPYVSWPAGQERAFVTRRQLDSFIGQVVAVTRADVLKEMGAE